MTMPAAVLPLSIRTREVDTVSPPAASVIPGQQAIKSKPPRNCRRLNRIKLVLQRFIAECKRQRLVIVDGDIDIGCHVAGRGKIGFICAA